MKNLTQTITCGILFFFLAGVFSPALAISIPEEKKLGEKFMSQIRAQGRLVEDPLTVKLIRTLGHEITQKLPPQPFDFHFYLIKNDTFN
ncbi:MAG: hypothetical protein MI749_11890, partial [Desulfovibrionales bacterium]|nr:hypothetical protein [Desulfovibrionales bacterium]